MTKKNTHSKTERQTETKTEKRENCGRGLYGHRSLVEIGDE